MKRATIDNADILPQENISIHALVKRATLIYDVYESEWVISIHALVKRAT